LNEELPKDLDKRLTLIFSTETVEPIATSNFIPIALDYIFGLSILNDAPLQGTTLSSHLLALLHPGERHSRGRHNTSKIDRTKVTPLVEADLEQINKLAALPAKDFVFALQGIYHNDQKVAHKLWASLFPSLWAAASDETRKSIEESFPNMPQNPTFLKYFSKLYPNPMQSFLLGFSRCQPAVKIAPQVLTALSRGFNCYHLAIRMLEDQLAASLPSPKSAVLMNLSALYRALNEEDFYTSTAAMNSTLPDTRAVLALEQMNMWHKAQRVLTQAQREYEKGLIPRVPTAELDLWQQHWEESCKKLNQWEVLCEFAKANSRYDLILQASWRLSEWDLLKESLKHFGPNAESAAPKFLQNTGLLAERRVLDMDQPLKNAGSILVNQLSSTVLLDYLC